MTPIDTQFIVPPEHPSLAGHFPGQPIVPGVVLLDSVLAAIQAAHGEQWRLHSIVSTKFLRAVTPATPLALSVSFAAANDTQWKARFVGQHSGATVLEGSFLIARKAEGDGA